MAWYITDGILQRADTAPAPDSVLTDITAEGALIVPRSVVSIGERAFAGCFGITSITLHDGVKHIGHKAFEKCFSVGQFLLEISASAKDISAVMMAADAAGYRFTNIVIDEGNEMFRLENGLLISQEGELLWGDSEIKEAVVPMGVKRIVSEVFTINQNLTSVELPDGVTSIEEHAFYFCGQLRKINIPDSVTSIAESAFIGCSRLLEIVLSDKHPTFCWENGMLISKDGTLIHVCTDLKKVVIPDGVKRVASGVLYQNDRLREVIFPDSVTQIGEDAFYGCTRLMNSVLPDGLERIERNAFVQCRSIKKIILPKQTSYIGDNAFSGCVDAEIVIEPEQLKRMNDNVLRMSRMIFCRISLDDVPEAMVRRKLCVGFAFNWEKYPEKLIREYLAYIKQNADRLIYEAFEHPVLLHMMCAARLIGAEHIGAFVDRALECERVDLRIVILNYQAEIKAGGGAQEDDKWDL